MKYPLFVEILTIGLILCFSFNWHKIYVRTKLRVKAFIRTHIAKRVDPDLDLDFIPKSKVQPTGDENVAVYTEIESKFIMGCDPIPLDGLDINRCVLFRLNNNTLPLKNLNSRIPYQGNGQPVYINRRLIL